jgi:F-type H+-transporting ATPase subunit b
MTGKHPSLPRACGWLAVTLLAVAGPASASEGGLRLAPDWPILFALLVLFFVLIFPVNALIFRPVFRVFDEREERIEGTRRRAKKLAEDADEIVARYENAVREVREQAETDRRKRLEVARGEGGSEVAGARSAAEREIENARASIAVTLEATRTTLRGEAEALAREVAARVLGRAL